MADERLIVALDVADAHAGMQIADRIGEACGFYKIGLGMLTGGGLALARELKDERGKRIFLDMKLFDIGATVEAAVRGLARFDLDFLTVHGDPHVVRAAKEGAGASGMKILGVTVLTSLDRADLDDCLYPAGTVAEVVVERARRARGGGAADRDAGRAAGGRGQGRPEAGDDTGRRDCGGGGPSGRGAAHLAGGGPGGGGRSHRGEPWLTRIA